MDDTDDPTVARRLLATPTLSFEVRERVGTGYALRAPRSATRSTWQCARTC
jgi:hypothetical protein